MTAADLQSYLVGGAVRDQLLGIDVSDRDWVVVGASTAAMLERGFVQVGKDFPVFLHPDTREEYALARRERKAGSGHTAFEFETGEAVTLEQDLLRRDLTINAMAQDADGNIIDPSGGRADLANGVLRHVSPAFVEDPLRVLRVARFAARFADRGFGVYDKTLQLMRDISDGGELATLPSERVWQETARALMENSPSVYWQVLARCGALPKLFPGIAALVSTAAHNHALPRAAAAQATLEQRFAISAFGMDANTLERLLAALKPPKACQALARGLQLGGLLGDERDATSLLELLESLDYLRRPERLRQFIDCQHWLGAPETYLQQLDTAVSAMRAVDNRALAERGFKGKALGEALRKARLQILEEAI